MQNTRLRIFLRLAFLGVLWMPGLSAALQSLDDGEMSGVTGEGMAFVWTDFRMMFDPESYIEQMGSPGTNTCTGTGQNSGNYNCFRRADLRWYGGNVSATGTAVGQGLTAGAWNTTWTTTGTEMTQCAGAGINGLGCPRGGPIQYFAAPDNPYILRVNTYDGGGSAATSIGNGVVTYQGNTVAAAWDPDNPSTGSRQTVLEFLAPASATISTHGYAQDPYRFSFWGEIESGRGAAGGGLLKSQTLIQGNAAGSAMRYFKFTQTLTSPGLSQPYNPLLGCSNKLCSDTTTTRDYKNRTLAIAYDSYLRGDFRFSVAQTAASQSDAMGVPVEFNATEGMYFRGADVHVALGQLFYQALTINMPRNALNNAPVQDGNFTLEIPILPNIPAVYTRFYSLTDYPTSNPAAPNADDDGYATARAAFLYSLPVRGGTGVAAYMPARTGTTITNYSAPDANYAKTHGYAHWGDWFICQGVGCSLPLTATPKSDADNGKGRNSWNSSGDGVFFVGTTAFNAYAYRVTAKDVRPNNNQHTTVQGYANYADCTPGSSTAVTQCGYGGAYFGNGGGVTAKNVSTDSSIFPAQNYFLNSSSTGFGAAANRSVISVPAGSALNIGDARLEGLQLNFLRFTSYGATY